MASSSNALHFSPSNPPPGFESLNPEDSNGDQAKIDRVDFTFQQYPGTGIGAYGTEYFKQEFSLWLAFIRSLPEEKEKKDEEKKKKLEETSKISWHFKDELNKMFPEDINQDSRKRLDATIEKYKQNENDTIKDIAELAKKTFDEEAAKHRDTHPFQSLIEIIQNNKGQPAMKRITKICAFGGGLIAHPEANDDATKEIYNACVFQHAAVFEIQEILESGEKKKIPIHFMDPAYNVLDKEVAELLGSSKGGAKVVEDKDNERKPWIELDENTFYISLQAPQHANQLVFELTKPAVWLHDTYLNVFSNPQPKVIKLHGEDYKIPMVGAPKYNPKKFEEDYKTIQLPLREVDVGNKEAKTAGTIGKEGVSRALGIPHLFLRNS